MRSAKITWTEAKSRWNDASELAEGMDGIETRFSAHLRQAQGSAQRPSRRVRRDLLFISRRFVSILTFIPLNVLRFYFFRSLSARYSSE